MWVRASIGPLAHYSLPDVSARNFCAGRRRRRSVYRRGRRIGDCFCGRFTTRTGAGTGKSFDAAASSHARHASRESARAREILSKICFSCRDKVFIGSRSIDSGIFRSRLLCLPTFSHVMGPVQLTGASAETSHSFSSGSSDFTMSSNSCELFTCSG